MKFLLKPLLAVLIIAAGPAWAEGGTTVQGGHSGAWYNLGQTGHGAFAEVLDDPTSPTGKRMVFAWYAFLNGRQVWILAVGDVMQEAEGQSAVMTAWIYEGNDFPPRFDSNQLEEIPWGEIRMYFIGCDDAVIEWESIIEGYGSGSLEVQRLTTISGTTCDPTLGGLPPPDDHGDTWQTATSFPVRLVYNDSIEGKHENRDDVDVFIFTLTDAQQVALFTIGPSDTEGTLYRIANNVETEIATDDNSGVNRNFVIEADLAAGTYSIHVTPTLVGIYGGYTLWLQSDDD